MTLSAQDARELDDFYSRAGFALRSVQGPILEKCMMMSVKHPPRRGPITARPTAEVREEPRSEPNEADFELFGRVSRKLRMLDASHRRAIDLLYGDRGSKLAALPGVKFGRLVALYEMLPRGKRLIRTLKAVEARKALKGPPWQGPLEDVATMEREAQDDAILLRERAEAAYTEAGLKLKAERRKPERQRFLRLVTGDDE